jgi:hypothetical protein
MFRLGIGAVLFAVVMVVVLVALVLAIASTRRTPAAEAQPLQPLEPVTPPTVAALIPVEARTVEQRLAEIDALHASGTITDAERDEARVRVITSL